MTRLGRSLTRQEPSWNTSRSERSRTDVSADQGAPLVLSFLQLLYFVIGIDVTIRETCLGITISCWLGGDGAGSMGLGFCFRQFQISKLEEIGKWIWKE